jgi:hypothetical protein
MPGLVSTSIAAELGRGGGEAPSTASVEEAAQVFARAFAAALGGVPVLAATAPGRIPGT